MPRDGDSDLLPLQTFALVYTEKTRRPGPAWTRPDSSSEGAGRHGGLESIGEGGDFRT